MPQPTEEQRRILRLDLGISDKIQDDLKLTRAEAEYLIDLKGRRR